MLKIKDLKAGVEDNNILNGINLEVNKGEVHAIMGPNGSGKSTLFNLITGNLKPDGGSVFYNDIDITGKEPFELFNLGILRTFQIAHEFSNLTVIENLMMVPGNQLGENLVTSIFSREKFRNQENEIKEKAFEVLKFLKIDHLMNEKAGNLSGGQKKLLELARTMMVDAKIVFLDEVGAGVNKSLLKEISESILKLNEERKYTFCIIEHDIDFITKLCNPVIVLAEGKVLFQGTAEEVKENNEVIESYLGKSS